MSPNDPRTREGGSHETKEWWSLITRFWSSSLLVQALLRTPNVTVLFSLFLVQFQNQATSTLSRCTPLPNFGSNKKCPAALGLPGRLCGCCGSSAARSSGAYLRGGTTDLFNRRYAFDQVGAESDAIRPGVLAFGSFRIAEFGCSSLVVAPCFKHLMAISVSLGGLNHPLWHLHKGFFDRFIWNSRAQCRLLPTACCPHCRPAAVPRVASASLGRALARDRACIRGGTLRPSLFSCSTSFCSRIILVHPRFPQR